MEESVAFEQIKNNNSIPYVTEIKKDEYVL